MNYHREALEEHDESIKNALSNIDPDTIAKTKEILNSKEFKKSWRKTGKTYKEFISAEEISQKKQTRQQFFRDLIITVIGALVGNADRIFIFIADLLKTLLAE